MKRGLALILFVFLAVLMIYTVSAAFPEDSAQDITSPQTAAPKPVSNFQASVGTDGSAVVLVWTDSVNFQTSPTPSSVLTGDFNNDGCVAYDDFQAFAGNFGSADVLYDINVNGEVDFSDFVLLASTYGQGNCAGKDLSAIDASQLEGGQPLGATTDTTQPPASQEVTDTTCSGNTPWSCYHPDQGVGCFANEEEAASQGYVEDCTLNGPGLTGGVVVGNKITGQGVFDGFINFFKRLFGGEVRGQQVGQQYIYRIYRNEQLLTTISSQSDGCHFANSILECSYTDLSVVAGQDYTYKVEVCTAGDVCSLFSNEVNVVLTSSTPISPVTYTEETAFRADYDENQIVNANDFPIFMEYYGVQDNLADLNLDSLVDFSDFVLFSSLTNVEARHTLYTAEAVRRADFNNDGFVDGIDASAFSTLFGQPGQGDINLDGIADFSDFVLLAEMTQNQEHYVPSPQVQAADYNNDFTVNVDDFTGFRLAFETGNLAADLNQDGVVSFSDFITFGKLVNVQPTYAYTRPVLEKADFNKDFYITSDDYDGFKSAWDSRNVQADLNGDGQIAFTDFVIFAKMVGDQARYDYALDILQQADFTNDLIVNVQDFEEFISAWRSQNARADLTQDGVVDFSDFVLFAQISSGSKSFVTTTVLSRADFTKDGQITQADYAGFQQAFDAKDLQIDLNADGHVTFEDFVIFALFVGEQAWYQRLTASLGPLSPNFLLGQYDGVSKTVTLSWTALTQSSFVVNTETNSAVGGVVFNTPLISHDNNQLTGLSVFDGIGNFFRRLFGGDVRGIQIQQGGLTKDIPLVYGIFRRESSTEQFVSIAQVAEADCGGAACSYVDTTAQPGKKYEYRITVVATENGAIVAQKDSNVLALTTFNANFVSTNQCVDGEDFLAFVNAFNQVATGDNAKYDLNGNGQVEFSDFTLLVGSYQQQPTCPVIGSCLPQGNYLAQADGSLIGNAGLQCCTDLTMSAAKAVGPGHVVSCEPSPPDDGTSQPSGPIVITPDASNPAWVYNWESATLKAQVTGGPFASVKLIWSASNSQVQSAFMSSAANVYSGIIPNYQPSGGPVYSQERTTFSYYFQVLDADGTVLATLGQDNPYVLNVLGAPSIKYHSKFDLNADGCVKQDDKTTYTAAPNKDLNGDGATNTGDVDYFTLFFTQLATDGEKTEVCTPCLDTKCEAPGEQCVERGEIYQSSQLCSLGKSFRTCVAGDKYQLGLPEMGTYCCSDGTWTLGTCTFTAGESVSQGQLVSTTGGKAAVAYINSIFMSFNLLPGQDVSSLVTATVHPYNQPPVTAAVEGKAALKFVSVASEDTRLEEAGTLIDTVALTFKYTDAELVAANVEENSLTIYWYDASSDQWVVQPTTINTDEKFVNITLNHLSFFGVYGTTVAGTTTPPADDGTTPPPSEGGGTTTPPSTPATKPVSTTSGGGTSSGGGFVAVQKGSQCIRIGINGLNNFLAQGYTRVTSCDRISTPSTTTGGTVPRVQQPPSAPSTTGGAGDSDSDGLQDVWELQYFGLLSQGPTGDYDNDGYSNAEEFAKGSDPTDAEDPGKGSNMILWIIIVVVVVGGIAWWFFLRKKSGMRMMQKESQQQSSADLSSLLKQRKQEMQSSVHPRLAAYVEKALRVGHSIQDIRESLLEAGWDKAQVKLALKGK